MIEYFREPLAHTESINSFLKNQLESHGIKTFGYIEIFGDGSFIQLESNKQIHTEILDSELSSTMSEYILSGMPAPNYHLSSSVTTPKNCLISVLKKKYELGNSLRFIDCRKDNNNNIKSIRHYYLAATADNASINNFYINNLDLIKKSFYDFSVNFQKIIDMVARTYPSSDKQEITKELYKEYIAKYFHQKNTQNHAFNYSSLPFELEKNALFNSNEKEVIYLYYNRFSLQEIADILEVSVRSINRYIRQVRLKLKCQSSNHIISTLLDRYTRIK